MENITSSADHITYQQIDEGRTIVGVGDPHATTVQQSSDAAAVSASESSSSTAEWYFNQEHYGGNASLHTQLSRHNTSINPIMSAKAQQTYTQSPPLILPASGLHHHASSEGISTNSASLPTATSTTTTTATTSTAGSTSSPEFLYQLTRMLTDNNREIIEWSNGKIEVHNPHKLETQVLNKYYRHSKFASFQRQLNYFGFRKQAGKGKMAPCSYINDATDGDVRSILSIKRKIPALVPLPTAKDLKKKLSNKSSSSSVAQKMKHSTLPDQLLSNRHSATESNYRSSNQTDVSANPLIVFNPLSPPTRNKPKFAPPSASSTPEEIARAAAGRGVRHSISFLQKPSSVSSSLSPTPFLESSVREEDSVALPMVPRQRECLSLLEHAYRNSQLLHDDFADNIHNHTLLSDDATAAATTDLMTDNPLFAGGGGFLSRNSSLIDLAMIHAVDGNEQPSTNPYSFGLTFDFPDTVETNSTTNSIHPSQGSPIGRGEEEGDTTSSTMKPLGRS